MFRVLSPLPYRYIVYTYLTLNEQNDLFIIPHMTYKIKKITYDFNLEKDLISLVQEGIDTKYFL